MSAVGGRARPGETRRVHPSDTLVPECTLPPCERGPLLRVMLQHPDVGAATLTSRVQRVGSPDWEGNICNE